MRNPGSLSMPELVNDRQGLICLGLQSQHLCNETFILGHTDIIEPCNVSLVCFVLYRRSKMHNHVLLINEMLGNILGLVLLWMELTCNSHEKRVKSSLFQHGAFFNKLLVQRKVTQLKANFSFQRAQKLNEIPLYRNPTIRGAHS